MNNYFTEAKEYIPGGLNSAFRSFNAVGKDEPIFMERGQGQYIYDCQGKEYIDFSLGWGPLIMGHNHPEISATAHDTINQGVLLGTPTQYETNLAALLRKVYPTMQQSLLQTSGTEAIALALRLARAYTKRDIVVTIDGGYHGHSNDVLLHTTQEFTSEPSSLGVPKTVHDHILHSTYGDLDRLQQLLSDNSVAAVLLEPAPGNMGFIIPNADYLRSVIEMCKQFGVLVIFDEVISGCRISPGGVTELYQLDPDIVVLGKALASGFPIGAVGASKEIMRLIETGEVYAAGTYAGNPLSVRTAIRTLEILTTTNQFSETTKRLQEITADINNDFKRVQFPAHMISCGTIFGIHFGTTSSLQNWKEMQSVDRSLFSEFHAHCIENGIYFSPSSEDCMFVSLVHTKQDLQKLRNVIFEFIKNKSD